MELTSAEGLNYIKLISALQSGSVWIVFALLKISLILPGQIEMPLYSIIVKFPEYRWWFISEGAKVIDAHW